MRTTTKALSLRLMAMFVVICMLFPMAAAATEEKVSKFQGFSLSNLNIDVDYQIATMHFDLRELAMEVMGGMSEELSRMIFSSNLSMKDKAAVSLAVDVSEKDTLVAIANSLLTFPTEKYGEVLAKLDPSFAQMGDAIQLSPAMTIEQYKEIGESIKNNTDAIDKLVAHLNLNYAPLFADPAVSDVKEGSETISFKGKEYDTTYTEVFTNKEHLVKLLMNVCDKIATDDELFELLNKANITIDDMTIQNIRATMAEARANANGVYEDELTTNLYKIGEKFVGFTCVLKVDESKLLNVKLFTFGEDDIAGVEFAATAKEDADEEVFLKYDYAPVVAGNDMSGTLNVSMNVMEPEDVPVYTREDQKKLDDHKAGKDVDITGIDEIWTDKKLVETAGFNMNNEFTITNYKDVLPSSIVAKGDISIVEEGKPINLGYTFDFAGDENGGKYGLDVTTSEELNTTVALKGDYSQKAATVGENGSSLSNIILDVSSMGVDVNITSKYDGVIALDADGVTTGEEGKYSLLIDVPLYETSVNLTCDTYFVNGPMREEYFINTSDAKVQDIMTMTDEELEVVKGEIMTELNKLFTAISEIPSIKMLIEGGM